MKRLASILKNFIATTLAFGLLCTAALPATAAEAVPRHTVYAGPSFYSAVVSSVSDGDTVTVLDRNHDTWARVLLADGTTGYCEVEILSASVTTESEEKCAAKALYASSVFSEEAYDASAVCRIAAGTTVLAKMPDEDDEFVEVRACDRIGYLPTYAVSVFSRATATVRSVPTLEATGATTEAEATEKLKTLSLYFENGRYWNHRNNPNATVEESAFCLSDTPCTHMLDGYVPCNIYSGSMCNAFPQYGYGTQCLGFASLMSDLIFGTDAPVTAYYDFNSIRVGDHIRLVYYEHSMIVTAVGTEADGTRFIRVAEVNEDYESCKIEWGRTLTAASLAYYGNGVVYYTRYSEN